MFVVSASFTDGNDMFHDLHLFDLKPDVANEQLRIALLETRRMNDSYNPVALGAPMDEGEKLMSNLGADGDNDDFLYGDTFSENDDNNDNDR